MRLYISTMMTIMCWLFLFFSLVLIFDLFFHFVMSLEVDEEILLMVFLDVLIFVLMFFLPKGSENNVNKKRTYSWLFFLILFLDTIIIFYCSIFRESNFVCSFVSLSLLIAISLCLIINQKVGI